MDRLPLVTSAIIQVAQDVDEPWPIEVVSHDGKRHNITMEPGDMILYESHTVLHGRPYPLKGKFYVSQLYFAGQTWMHMILIDTGTFQIVLTYQIFASYHTGKYLCSFCPDQP